MLLLLRGNFVPAFFNLPGRLLPQSAQFLSHLRLKVFPLFGKLGERLPQGLFLGEGLSTLRLQISQLALKKVDASAVFLLLFFDFRMQFL